MDALALDDMLQRGETRNVEIKGACSFEGDMRAHLAHSIGCLANTPDGGTIIIGVENGTWSVQGLTQKQLETFDTTKIANYLKARFAPMPRFTVERIAHPDGTVLLLQVPEFDDVPIVTIKQIAQSDGKVYARESDLLIRSESRECRRISSPEEMRDLLSRALARRQETLLAQIRAIMTGAAPTLPETPPEDLFADALPAWESTLSTWSKQRPQCAWWEVNILPVPALPKPVEANRMVELVSNAAVHLRGWYYPTYGVMNQDFAYTQSYAHLAYESKRESERWQVSYEGAFGSAHVMRIEMLTDLDSHRHPPPPDRLIDYIDICWSLTEFFRFATSFAEGLGCEALWMRVGLHNVKGRVLGAIDPRYGFLDAGGTSSMASVVQSRIFPAVELASAWRETALDWTKQILTVFQWPEASRERLAAHQERLIERRL